MKNLAPPAPYSNRDRWLIGIVIFLVALAHVVSFAYLSSLAAHNPQAQPYPIVAGDSQEYALLAENLLVHHVFSDSPDLSPARNWPPGYSVFLAGIKWATGSFKFAAVIQSLLAFLAVFLVYAILRRFVPPVYAACITLLYGLDPMLVFSDTAIISDGFFASLLVLIIYIAFFQSRMRGVLRWAILGLLLAIATMIRPIAEFLIVIVPAAFMLREYLRIPLQREEKFPLPAFAAYILCVALIITPWIIRNHNTFGVFELSHVGQSDLLYYDVRDFLAWRQMVYEKPTSIFYPAHHINDPAFSVVDSEIRTALAQEVPAGADPDNYDSSVALHFILHDPVRFAYFYIGNTTPFFFSSSIAMYGQIADQERNNSDLSASTLNAAENALAQIRSSGFSGGAAAVLAPILLEVAYWSFMCLLALVGVIWERQRFEAWLCAGLVVYFAILTGPLSIARYRIPAEPFLLMLAAVGLYGIVSYFAKSRVFEHTALQ